jgi:hypothetical protein
MASAWWRLSTELASWFTPPAAELSSRMAAWRSTARPFGTGPLTGHRLIGEAELEGVQDDAAGGEQAPHRDPGSGGGQNHLALRGEHELAHLAPGPDVEMPLGKKACSRLAQARQALVDHAPTTRYVYPCPGYATRRAGRQEGRDD